MIAEPDVTRLARTLGDPTRIRMMMLLMEGRALTAKELAYGAGVEPATGTEHLKRLSQDGLVVSTVQGRHKYFRLASPRVAECIESLMTIAQPAKTVPNPKLEPIQLARFCYDHLAGHLGVQITRALLAEKVLVTHDKEFVVTPKGNLWFREFGINLEAVRKNRRKFAVVCLDWSERRDHLGGALGAALAQRMLDRGWIEREMNSRVILLSAKGKRLLKSGFGAWN